MTAQDRSRKRPHPVDAVVAGHICLDISPAFDAGNAGLGRILVPGKLVHTGEAVLSPGGAVHNTGVNLKKMGLRVSLMGKVGADRFGDIVLSLLDERGGHEGMRRVDGEQTSYTVVLAPPGVDRIFLHHPGANDTYTFRDIDFDTVARSRLFHLGYPSLMRRMYLDRGSELRRIFRTAKSLGVVTSLDLALPDPDSEAGRADWPGILSSVLEFVDICMPSVEELMYMTDRRRFDAIRRKAGGRDAVGFYGTADIRRLSDFLIGEGVKIAVLKAGIRGAWLSTADAPSFGKIGGMTGRGVSKWAGRRIRVDAFRTRKFVSSTGAGDSFIAGFLAAFLRGFGPEETLRTAACVASQNVTAMDATSGVGDWKRTVQLLNDLPRSVHPG